MKLVLEGLSNFQLRLMYMHCLLPLPSALGYTRPKQQMA